MTQRLWAERYDFSPFWLTGSGSRETLRRVQGLDWAIGRSNWYSRLHLNEAHADT
ncbi:MAG: hypothetical protein HC866_12665 [Leptolyngbyaceae cyanobacterium RU_5_1]|nr:hypothetical protein [Leptolyngbyaceae cyanobacterium RU_5_1]